MSVKPLPPFPPIFKSKLIGQLVFIGGATRACDGVRRAEVNSIRVCLYVGGFRLRRFSLIVSALKPGIVPQGAPLAAISGWS